MNALPIRLSYIVLLVVVISGHTRLAAGQEAAPPPTDAVPRAKLAEHESSPPRDEPPADPQQEFGVYRLKYAEAQEAAKTVDEVLGGLKGLRIAVDSRTNSLLVYATDEQGKIIGNLLQVLDTPENRSEPEEADASARHERRLVIYWLASGRDFETEKRLPQQLSPVVKELQRLGLKDLQLVSRSIAGLDGTSVTLNNFVHIGDRTFRLQLEGRLLAGSGPSDVPRLNLAVKAQDSQGGPGSTLDTSIKTPYNHFMVLGTAGHGDLEYAFVIQLQAVEATK